MLKLHRIRGGGVAAGRGVQGGPKVSSTPTSAEPPVPEWAPHYWYTIRCVAMQAGPVLRKDDAGNDIDSDVDEEATAAKAVRTVGWFEALQDGLPCPECRGHYARDWKTFPFTASHAVDAALAQKWVGDLFARIEARKRAERAGAGGRPEAEEKTRAEPEPGRTGETPVDLDLDLAVDLGPRRAGAAGPPPPPPPRRRVSIAGRGGFGLALGLGRGGSLPMSHIGARNSQKSMSSSRTAAAPAAASPPSSAAAPKRGGCRNCGR
jgi:hypothetical protein